MQAAAVYQSVRRWRAPIALAVAVLLGPAALAPAAIGAVSAGSQPNSGGLTWGVGVGANCRDVIERMRRNWLDVRGIVAPDSKSMRPRSRGFYCVSPAYARESLPKTVPMTTGLRCFDIQGKGFCCDRRLEQCATM